MLVPAELAQDHAEEEYHDGGVVLDLHGVEPKYISRLLHALVQVNFHHLEARDRADGAAGRELEAEVACGIEVEVGVVHGEGDDDRARALIEPEHLVLWWAAQRKRRQRGMRGGDEEAAYGGGAVRVWPGWFLCLAPVRRGSEEARHQKSSEAIRSHQKSSEVIRSHQKPSEAIRSHQKSSEAIRSHRTSSSRSSIMRSLGTRGMSAPGSGSSGLMSRT